MKRIEAIRKLANFLNKTFKDIEVGDSEAKQILDFLENDLELLPKEEWEK